MIWPLLSVAFLVFGVVDLHAGDTAEGLARIQIAILALILHELRATR